MDSRNDFNYTSQNTHFLESSLTFVTEEGYHSVE